MDYGMKSISDYLTSAEEDKELIKGIEDGNIMTVLGHKSLMALVHDGNPRLLSFLCHSDNLIKILTVATSTKSQYLMEQDSNDKNEDKEEVEKIINLYDDESASAGIRSLIEAAPSRFCIAAATNKDVLKWARGNVKRAGCISKLALKRGVADEATEEFTREILCNGNYGVSGIPNSDTLNSICEHIAEHHNCYYSYNNNTTVGNQYGTENDEVDARDPESVKTLVRALLSKKFSNRTTAEWLSDIARSGKDPKNIAEAFNSLSLLLLSTHRQLECAALYAGWMEPWDIKEMMEKKQKSEGINIYEELDNKEDVDDAKIPKIESFPLTKESLRFAVISARLIATRWGVADENIEDYESRRLNKGQNQGSNYIHQQNSSMRLQASVLSSNSCEDGKLSPLLERTDDVPEPSVDGYCVHDYETMSDDGNKIEELIPYQDVLRSVPMISPIDAGRILQHIIDWMASFFEDDKPDKLPLKTLLDLVSTTSEFVGLPHKTLEFNKLNKIAPYGVTQGLGASGSGNNPFNTTGNSGDFFFSSYGGNSFYSSQISPENLLIVLKSGQNLPNEKLNEISIGDFTKSPTVEGEEMKEKDFNDCNSEEGLENIQILLNNDIATRNSKNICMENNINNKSPENKQPSSSNTTTNGKNAIPGTNSSVNLGNVCYYKVPPASPLRILVGFHRKGVISTISRLIFGTDEKPTPPSRLRCSILHSVYIRLVACYIEFAGIIQEANDVIHDTIVTIYNHLFKEPKDKTTVADQIANKKVQIYRDSLCKSLLRLITLTVAGEYIADEVAGSISTLSDIGKDNPLLMSSSGRSGIVGSEVSGVSWSGSGTNITLFKVQGNGIFEGVPVQDVCRELRERINKTMAANKAVNVLNTPVCYQGQVSYSSASLKSSNSLSSSIVSPTGLGFINIGLYSGITDTILGILLERLQKKRKQNIQGRGNTGSAGSSSFTFSSLGNSLGRGSVGLNINVSDIGYAVSSGAQLGTSSYCTIASPVVSSSAILEIINNINNDAKKEEQNDATGAYVTKDNNYSYNGAAGTSSSLSCTGRGGQAPSVYDSLLEDLIMPDEEHGCRFDSQIVNKNISLREAMEVQREVEAKHNKNPMRPFNGKVRKSKNKNHSHNGGTADGDESSSSSLSLTSSSSQDSFSDNDDFTPISDPKSSSDYSTSDEEDDEKYYNGNGDVRTKNICRINSVKPITKSSQKDANIPSSSAQAYFDDLLNSSGDDDDLIFESPNEKNDKKGNKQWKSIVIKNTDEWNFDSDDSFKPEPNTTGGNIDGEGDFHPDFQTDFQGGFSNDFHATFDGNGAAFETNFGTDDMMGYDFKFETDTAFEDNKDEGK